jgi:hypothetical protein
MVNSSRVREPEHEVDIENFRKVSRILIWALERKGPHGTIRHR